jgi:hypothetical protein
MNLKFKINRRVRIHENHNLIEYTGIIFVSNKIFKPNTNTSLPLKVNTTKFFLNNNTFFLENKYIGKEVDLISVLSTKYKLKQNMILNTDVIYKKKNKIIYLISLNFNTENKFLTTYTMMNLYDINNIKTYNDLYLTIYNREKGIKYKDYYLYKDNTKYIKINLIDIYYYLIGNEYANKDLKEHIII